MRRRNLLAGTTGAVCGLAGCTGSTFERFQSEHPGTDGDESDVDSSDDAVSNSADTIEVGDPDEVPFLDAHPPHEFELRNEGEAGRTVSVTITADGGGDDETDDGDDGTDALLERDFDLAAGDALTLVLVEPRSYAITAATSGDGGTSESTVGVDRSPFDCTRSRTTLTLSETGTRTESTSSSISCPVPAIADASLEVGERECAGETDVDSAAVEFAGETVLVDGEITTPTPCHSLSLAETDYDERRDVLAITVAVGDQAGGTCTDCLGTVDYEARVDLEGRYPGRIEIYHEGRDEARRITVAEY